MNIFVCKVNIKIYILKQIDLKMSCFSKCYNGIKQNRSTSFGVSRGACFGYKAFIVFRSVALGFLDVVDEPFADFAGAVGFGTFGGDVFGHYFGIHRCADGLTHEFGLGLEVERIVEHHGR